MSKKMYGSLNNRLEEGKIYGKEIYVGMGATEYMWSDSYAYEVTKVINQQHVFIRRYDARAIGGFASNKWELTSNPNAPEIELEFNRGSWKKVYVYTKQKLIEKAKKHEISSNEDVGYRYFLGISGLTEKQIEKLEQGKKIKKYSKTDGRLSFGVAREYYDYEF